MDVFEDMEKEIRKRGVRVEERLRLLELLKDSKGKNLLIQDLKKRDEEIQSAVGKVLEVNR